MVQAVGRSDHFGVTVVKYSRELKTCPKVSKRRSYKNFNKEAFLADIARTNFDQIFIEKCIDAATVMFTNIYNSVLDRHAPVKTVQNRKHYVPYICLLYTSPSPRDS